MMKPVLLPLLFCCGLLAGCLAPGGGAPAPTPTPVTSYSPAQLKYLLLDHFGEDRFFYCDPDFYPVGRGDEEQRAVQAFPAIENETAVFSAIVAHTGSRPPYTNESILAIYREYKKLNAIPLAQVSPGTYSFSLRLGTTGQGLEVTGTIRNDGTLLNEQSGAAFLTCPVCLAGETLIGTPSGPVPVKDLRPGMPVWTPGPGGTREPVPVLRAERTRVARGHRVVRLRLSDGRQLAASPGHLLLDGRPLGSLAAGAVVDGATVTGADMVPFDEEFTYDILPAGDTGGYWADGIPLESTLR